jgi:putative PIN family toxin of toxin-antitoxin system
MTPRIVIDTNILVSALIQPKGIPASLLDGVALRGLTLYVSEEILAEYREVLSRPKFARIDPVHASRLFEILAAEAIMIVPKRLSTAALHEPDNRFLECAEAAEAAYLVTGNTKHFPECYGSTKIVTPRQYWDVVKGSSPSKK